MTGEEREIDLSNVLEASHDNTWVAIARDYSRVIASTSTLRELMHSMGEQDVIYHRVLPKNVSFAPTA